MLDLSNARNGCEVQSHEASEAFDLAKGDYKKITNRIVAN